MSSCEGCSSLPLDFACWWPKGIWRPCDDHVRGRYACSTGKSGILHVDEWEPCYKLDSRFHGANVWPISPDWAHVAPILSSRTWWPHDMWWNRFPHCLPLMRKTVWWSRWVAFIESFVFLSVWINSEINSQLTINRVNCDSGNKLGELCGAGYEQ